MMNVKQKETLINLGIGHEWVLDGLKPHEFSKFPAFGLVYVEYIKQLRGIHIPVSRNLLDPEEDSSDLTAPPYESQPPTFHALESGRVDVRLTLNLSATQGRWLENLAAQLPDMFPGEPHKHDLGFAVAPWILESMKQDTVRRHGQIPVGNHSGTMTKAQLAEFRKA